MSRLSVFEEALEVTAVGEIWECGCHEGDFALQLLPFLRRRTLRLFDTFEGMPAAGKNDRHPVGSMKADHDKVVARFKPWSNVHVHKGRMPASFVGLEDTLLSVVNLDVDNEECVRECLPWLYEHLCPGGYLVIDDYNCGSCPGAKLAVDDFMRGKPEQLLTYPDSGCATIIPQAYLIKR